MNNTILIIAEVGSVHDGSLGNAIKLIDIAADSGADAVKFQTHIAEAETLKDAPSPSYFKGEPRYEYFQRTAFSKDSWHKIKTHADEKGLGFISSPFSLEAVELLESIGVSRYKIASGEVTTIPLLEKIAETKKPVILSTGMSNWEEIEMAIETLKSNGCENLTLLQCTSAYPCGPEEVGLNIITEMIERFKVPVGFSDHTQGTFAAIGATVLGAKVIEKHITFSRLMYGSDAPYATTPEEFKNYVKEIRNVSIALSNPLDKNSQAKALSEMKLIFQKSIVAKTTLEKGTEITHEHLAYKKPGDAIPSGDYIKLIGKKLCVDVQKDHKFQWTDFQ